MIDVKNELKLFVESWSELISITTRQDFSCFCTLTQHLIRLYLKSYCTHFSTLSLACYDKYLTMHPRVIKLWWNRLYSHNFFDAIYFRSGVIHCERLYLHTDFDFSESKSIQIHFTKIVQKKCESIPWVLVCINFIRSHARNPSIKIVYTVILIKWSRKWLG